MRDIRQDLLERLAAVDARHRDVMASYDERRAELERELRENVAEIERERTALKDLITAEAKREGRAVEAALTPARLPLPEFLVTKVHAVGPIGKEALRIEASAAGYLDDGNGRAFHATLMNMWRAGKLVKLPDGRYAFPKAPTPTPSLFGMGNAEEGQPLMQ